MTYIYDKDTFVTIPTDDDFFIKIRDKSGKTVKTITDEYCNTTLSGTIILIKQRADTKQSNYSFDTVENARIALINLDLALSKLKENKKNKNTNNNNLNEDICKDSRKTVLLSSIWTESDQIPDSAPFTSNSYVQYFDKLTLNYINGTYSFNHSSFIDIIPPYVDSTYIVKVYTYDNVLIPDGFKGLTIDWECGIIEFKNGFSNIGTIQVDGTKLPKVTFHKYIGSKGDITSFLSFKTFTFKPNIDNQTVLDTNNTLNQIIQLSVNGQIISNYNDEDYNYSGTIINWVSTTFSLATTDIINIVYK